MEYGKLPSIDKKETGENIKRLMRLNHIAITQLQLTLGMSSATNIYKWCRGELTPSSDRLVHLSRIFNCKIEDILVVKEN
jgi:transcriptional regulator with XRE-family HTH domain